MNRTLLVGTALLCAAPVAAQDANFGEWQIDTIEARLRDADLQVLGVRRIHDLARTLQVTLRFDDGGIMNAKLAAAAPGASTFNNEPRYELAAYRIQKLFLRPDEYVVPPTVLRMEPTEWLRQYDEGASRTFDDGRSTLFVLQFWLNWVTSVDVWDRDRLKTDSVYARHMANLNILTYLIRHRDANPGNFLISEFAANPRVFSVDNGVSFRSRDSDQGTVWSRMRVERLPHATVERLRTITREQLDALGVLVQYELHGPYHEPVAIGPDLDPGDGVVHEDGVVQLGLTEREIRDVWSRLQDLLEDIDKGNYEIF